jgi:hypothetical protein
MADVAKKITQIGPSEQVSEENQPEKPWERMKNEPALWYMRFQVYLKMGSKRSLQAALTKEPDTQEAPKGTKKPKEKNGLSDVSISVPGSWKRACKLWNWVGRAEAYDQHIQDTQALVVRKAACSQEYSSRAWRVMELNNLATILKNNLKACNDVKDLNILVGRIQSIFHDISEEMAKLGMENEADAEVMTTFIKQRAKS